MTTTPTSGASYAIDAIGRLHGCFPEKFGVPRQPGLCLAARGEIEILAPFNRPEAFRGLEGISHIWVTFLFHENLGREWQPTIRPPRLGGNKRVGVFASRSSFRPNGLGLSLLKLAGLSIQETDVRLLVEGVDMVDQTPIVDIKPYLPYADTAPDARAGWAEIPPETRLEVRFSEEAAQAIANLMQAGATSSTAGLLPSARRQRSGPAYPMLKELIVDVLSADPRPTYRRGKPDARSYGTRLYDLDVRWCVEADRVARVLTVAPFDIGSR